MLPRAPRLLAVFKGPTSKGREREGGGEGKGKGRGRVRRVPPIGESGSASGNDNELSKRRERARKHITLRYVLVPGYGDKYARNQIQPNKQLAIQKHPIVV